MRLHRIGREQRCFYSSCRPVSRPPVSARKRPRSRCADCVGPAHLLTCSAWPRPYFAERSCCCCCCGWMGRGGPRCEVMSDCSARVGCEAIALGRCGATAGVADVDVDADADVKVDVEYLLRWWCGLRHGAWISHRRAHSKMICMLSALTSSAAGAGAAYLLLADHACSYGIRMASRRRHPGSHASQGLLSPRQGALLSRRRQGAANPTAGRIKVVGSRVRRGFEAAQLATLCRRHRSLALLAAFDGRSMRAAASLRRAQI